ncbi:TniB family NTP-binding protein [Microvirga soli]|uniref:TniB family NTP-binding protein n=1 Tax=Microvirga soli TaxID=1854496 RepID=UPI00191E096F|nr:TniB family NTP-binding protein [Microvirga soli]
MNAAVPFPTPSNPWAVMQSVFVEHPLFDDIMAEVEDVLSLHGSAAEVPCVMISGVTGIGKSTLFKKLVERHPVTKDGRRTVLASSEELTVDDVPLLALEMPSRPRVMPVAKAMLKALGDPLWNKGKREDLEDRVDLFLRACGTKGVLIDEAQRAVDRNGALTAADLIDWIKSRHGNTGISFIFLGLPRMRYLVEQDGQFDRRWDNDIPMPPYDWGPDIPPQDTLDEEDEENKEPESRLFFYGLLAAFQRESPVPFAAEIDVGDYTTAKRFYYASRGVIGRLKKLLAMAMRVIMREKKDTQITLAVLEKAFDRAFRKDKAIERLVNPFGRAWKGELPPPLPQDDVPVPRARPQPRGGQAPNRGGRGRKAERNLAVVAALTKRS